MDALFNMPHKRSPVELERWNRIKLAVCAYAYEIKDDPFISDADYDALALSIRPSICTGRKVLDDFFKTKFSAHTGQWIHNHPELEKLAIYYLSLKAHCPDWARAYEKKEIEK